MKRTYQSVVVVAILATLSGWLCYHRVAANYYHSPTISSYVTKGPYAEDKVVVLAQITGENASWVNDELPEYGFHAHTIIGSCTDHLSSWQNAIYHADDPEWTLHVPQNKGREAMVYLTFLIDHYPDLPDIMVFLHPHKQGWPQAWHTDAQGYDNAESVRSLHLDYVRQHGYANMRCIWNPGCPVELQPFMRRHGDSLSEQTERAYGAAWMQLFQTDNSTIPEHVATPCCSQFAVSKEQVHKRPLTDYKRMRQWLLDTELSDDISGRVMEYTWHVILGKEAAWCPPFHECWCQQFGRC